MTRIIRHQSVEPTRSDSTPSVCGGCIIETEPKDNQFENLRLCRIAAPITKLSTFINKASSSSLQGSYTRLSASYFRTISVHSGTNPRRVTRTLLPPLSAQHGRAARARCG
jgi:hypothetical protein